MSERCWHHTRRATPSMLAFSLLVLALAAPVHAEPTALQRSTAEALFQQGVELTQSGKYAEACPKLEASLEIERTLGTMLRLADCYDRAGKSASAWGLFTQVAELASKAGDETRREIARGRADDLQKRLSLLQFRLSGSTADVLVDIGGVRVPSVALGAPLPSDPGSTEIVVSAPGRAPWRSVHVVPQGPALTKIEVPELAPLPRAQPQPGSLGPSSAATDSARPLLPTWSIVLGATGLIGLGIGGYLTYRADAANEDSLAKCRPDDARACTPQGVALRSDARHLANGATLSLVLGGAALGGGAALAIWRGDSDEPGVQASAFFSSDAQGVAVSGDF